MKSATHTLVPGAAAPDFLLRNQHGETVELAQLRGGPSMLMFYPFAFSRVCSAELAELINRWSEITALGLRVCAISCDSIHTLRAYADEIGGVEFDLLSDFWPHGAAAEAYGAFDAQKGCPRRNTWILDAQLRLHRRVSAEFSASRDLDQVLSAAGELRQG